MVIATDFDGGFRAARASAEAAFRPPGLAPPPVMVQRSAPAARLVLGRRGQPVLKVLRPRGAGQIEMPL